MNIIELAKQAELIDFRDTENTVPESFRTAIETVARLVIEEHLKGVDMEPVAFMTRYGNVARGDNVRSEIPFADKEDYTIPLYTATQMAAQRQRALDEAGMACMKLETAIDGGGNAYYRPADARQCVAAIRALGVKG